MEKKLPKHKLRWQLGVVLLLAAALLLLAAASSGARTELSRPEQLLRELVRPLQNGINSFYAQLEQLPAYFGGAAVWETENRELQQEISLLEQEISLAAGLAAENRALRQLLDLERELADWQPLAANVIARNDQSWRQYLVIDKGARQGLASGQPVLSGSGLVGRVTAVSPQSAEVLLLTATESAVSALIAESRWCGIVEADGSGGLSLIHLPILADCSEGQQVISSGLGGVFPAGLPIGTLTLEGREEDGLSQRLRLNALADFDRLEYLLVLRPAENEAAEAAALQRPAQLQFPGLALFAPHRQTPEALPVTGPGTVPQTEEGLQYD